MNSTDLQSDYDPVAEDYAREFCDEMNGNPFDRKMLDRLVEKVKRDNFPNCPTYRQ